ncbi:hypothetical protein R5R35_008856 [Gryllus longicercus]|uniref:Uncharacterized protein n=1 Tax=Gryllus longicercus TaxID=2509291 RepID=A0AAN9VHA6_9ORTH
MALAALAVSGGAEAGYAYGRPATGLVYGGGGGGGSYVSRSGDTLTVLADEPYAVDSALAAVPLLVIPSSQLRVVHDARIAAVSPTRPVVTLQAPEREATPAVRVVLARPMVVSSPETTIPFPAGFTVVHQGLRMPIPVGAVLAPVPSGALITASHPYAVRVVYAVPTGPLPFAYPFHSQYPFSHPLFINAGPVSGTALATVPVRPGFGAQRPGLAPTYPRPGFGAQRPGLAPSRPVGPSTPAPPAAPPASPAPPSAPELPSRPQQQIPPRPPFVSSGRPVVTVLDFPSAIASPPVLVVQRPVFGEEDELSSPPQAVVPAGIVQSTQPRPIQSVFSNSKDNEFLQQMRDQAALNAAAGGSGGTGGSSGNGVDVQLADYDKIVEVLYN